MNLDKDIFIKIRKTSEKVSENIHIVANDPSLAFFRIQEHVRKVLPAVAEKKGHVTKYRSNILGHCYDMEYSLSAVKNIENSVDVFKNVLDMMKTSIFLKQQLKYNTNKKSTKNTNPVYKRFSAHLMLEIPDLPDIGGVMRETSIHVQTLMSNNKSSSSPQTCELQRSHTTLH